MTYSPDTVKQFYPEHKKKIPKKYIDRKTNRLSPKYFFEDGDGSPTARFAPLMVTPKLEIDVPYVIGCFPFTVLPFCVEVQIPRPIDFAIRNTELQAMHDWLSFNTTGPWMRWVIGRDRDCFAFYSKRDADMFAIFKRIGAFNES